MLSFALSKIFGKSAAAAMRERMATVAAINALETGFRNIPDDALRLRADDLRQRVVNGQRGSAALVEAFALVREASLRVLGQRHYDVQLVGGMILDEGSIAEMRTGEGKTLVAALPTFLNALSGKGVHVVTVNDYLARRDMEIVGGVHRLLGLSVGVISQGMPDADRRIAYGCDVTYCTNSELGFDYLRDNLRFDVSQSVQRGHHYAIVDEVDSILIDEARTPLIISGPTEDRSSLYLALDALMGRLPGEWVLLDEKMKAVTLSDEGTNLIEDLLRGEGLISDGQSLYDHGNANLVHHVNLALKAHHLFRRDRDYLVRGGEVLIVDEFTGRTMIGRRYSDGIHQAIEAKEGVAIQSESATLSSITYQNLFRMYAKLSGMTGTAMTERDEFADIYKLDVVTVPTNRPVARIDEEDEVHLSEAAKLAAIVKAVQEAHGRRQPVLVGTSSVEKSEIIARALVDAGFARADFIDPGTEAAGSVIHVLNARHHGNEARIVARAGLPGAVTIATNMAGRGTDIQLGGSAEARIAEELEGVPEGIDRVEREMAIIEEVSAARREAKAAGGLFVIGTERHESRRVDNQLRGRSGRQGDPGRSRFYVSLDDDIARIFGPERMRKLLPTLGLRDGEAIVHPWISRALEKAQIKVEASNFDIRKNLIKFDDVNDGQRKAIYAFRNDITSTDDVSEWIQGMRSNVIEAILDERIPPDSYPEQWDAEGLARDATEVLGLDSPVMDWISEEGVGRKEIGARFEAAAAAKLTGIEEIVSSASMRQAEKTILLTAFDRVWQQHLSALEGLRAVIGWRSIAQRNPVDEYRTEAYEMFEAMMRSLWRDVTTMICGINIVRQDDVPEAGAAQDAA